jgi:MacB-like periplasmic core domain
VPKVETFQDLVLEPRKGGQEMWRWLYTELRSAIIEGRLKSGARLPSTRNLAICSWEGRRAWTQALGVNLSNPGGDPERLMGERYTWNIFSLLGVKPLVGRVFQPEEDRPGFEHVTLISYRLWHGRFGADPNVIGRDLVLNGDKYRVIGVMPPGFSFPGKDADLWIPVAFTSQQLASRGEHYLQVVARLQPRVSLKQANAELQVLAQHLIRQNPDIMKFVDGFVAEPLQETYTRGTCAADSSCFWPLCGLFS